MASVVQVPGLIGLSVPVARSIAMDLGLVLSSGDPDGVPLGEQTWPGTWVVTTQRPSPGMAANRGDVIVISFERRDGGSAGDREPRVPLPPDREMTLYIAEPGFGSEIEVDPTPLESER